MMAATARGFVGPDAPKAKEIDACVHCGLCLPVCPTYKETKNEASSPRGRIYLMGAVLDGRLPITDGFADEMHFCLGCRACETACPSSVEFGQLVELARAQTEQALPKPLPARLARRLLLQGLIPHPGRLVWVIRLTRLYQRLGLSRWVRESGLLDEIPGLKVAEALIPPLDRWARPGPETGAYPRGGDGNGKVAFFRGCVMTALFGETNRRTVDLLRENGCDVDVPGGQTCCGALHLHSGLREEARALARRNVAAFDDDDVDAIVVNAAGCGATLREYPLLLASDSRLAEKAKVFGSKVRDVSESLASLPKRQPFPPLRARAVYQDACHLAHGQGVRSAPRALLDEVPGLEVTPVPEADSCCGSAGVYNLTHPEFASRILDRKMDFIAAADPDFIISGNPGCILQLAFGVRRRALRARVIHTVDALRGGETA